VVIHCALSPHQIHHLFMICRPVRIVNAKEICFNLFTWPE
jgi:hypothetical protein